MTKFMILLIVFLITFVLAITLGIHNSQLVDFNYLIAQGSYRLSNLLIMTFFFGFILAWGICLIFYLKVMFKLKRTQRRLSKLESEKQQYFALTDSKS